MVQGINKLPTVCQSVTLIPLTICLICCRLLCGKMVLSVTFDMAALDNTDDYLTDYDHNSCQHTNAVHQILDTVFATRTPPATNKCQKRKGAKATKKLEQLESVGHELNPRVATSFRALSARGKYLAQDRPDIAYSAKELRR